MKQIEEQLDVLRKEIAELSETLPGWDGDARSKGGGARYRSIAKRIVESARRLESLVKENTYPTA
jgi:hypothetical protein